eukprot:sb/3473781/
MGKLAGWMIKETSSEGIVASQLLRSLSNSKSSTRNRPNQDILVPGWLITSHVTSITSCDWLFTWSGRFFWSPLPQSLLHGDQGDHSDQEEALSCLGGGRICPGSPPSPNLGHLERGMLYFWWEMLVPDWLITSHVTRITSPDWLFT